MLEEVRVCVGVCGQLATLDAVVAYRRLHSHTDDTALLFGVSTEELLEHERRRAAEESAAAAAAAAAESASSAAARDTGSDACGAKTLRRHRSASEGVSAAASVPRFAAAGAGSRWRGARPAPGGLSYMEPLLGTHALLRLPESREGRTRQGGRQRAGRLRAARCGVAEGTTAPEGAFPPLGVVRMTPPAAHTAVYEWQHTPLFYPEVHLAQLRLQ